MPMWLREAWDRLVASDPGLSRLRTAAAGAGSLASALGVELVAATLLGAQGMQVLLFLLMGGMVAMMGSMALSGLGPGVWLKIRTAMFFPVAFGAGLSAGMMAHGYAHLVLGGFVAMMFAAVFVRRFGIPFFFYGFMAWIGYLFASLLGATFAMLPILLLALVIGAGWVLLLSLTVLRGNTTRMLTRTVHAFHARVRTIAAVCADLADIDVGDQHEFGRWQTRLHRQLRRLSEAALMIEASSGQQQALPDAQAGQQLRTYALEAQLAIEALAGSTEAIAIADPGRAKQAATVAGRVARRDLAGARRAAERLQREMRPAAEQTGDWWPAYRLTEAISEFSALAAQVPDFSPAGLSRIDHHRPAAATDDAAGQEFRSAVALMMGNLPSSAAVARDVSPRGPQWLLGRLSMTTRQAIQVALASGLAILAGHALSERRYYWALIAVFVTFTGTATRAESVRKALYRLLGTLAGLVAAMLLAHITAGHTVLVLVVIVASLFCGFYLIRISYAFMIFFITIMVAQLYNVLGEYSNELLVLRLEETAIGAAVGIGVALIFLPLSTRDTVRTVRDSVLTTLAQALDHIADRLDMVTPDPAEASQVSCSAVAVAHARPATDGADPVGTSGADAHNSSAEEESEEDAAEPPQLEELARQLDDHVRQLALVATPFSRPAMWGNNGRHLRYRLTRFAAIAGNIRAITVTLRRVPEGSQPALAEVCRSLAETATALTTDGQPTRDRETGAGATPDRIPERLHTQAPDATPPPHQALTRALIQIDDLLAEIGPSIPGRAPSTGRE